MIEKNKEYFQEHLKDYKVSYLREDEEVLVNKYFSHKGSLLVLGCGGGEDITSVVQKRLQNYSYRYYS